jgi:hypothetical protein
MIPADSRKKEKNSEYWAQSQSFCDEYTFFLLNIPASPPPTKTSLGAELVHLNFLLLLVFPDIRKRSTMK